MSTGEPLCKAEPSRPRLRIASGPISLWTLAFWGLVLFAVAVFHGHQLSVLDRAAILPLESAAARPSPVASASAVAPPATVATAAAPVAASQPTASQVEIRLMKYSPAELEVTAGTRVEWRNDDLTPHTVTSAAKQFDSGAINPGASWQQTFTEAGKFPYLCTFHPEMNGVVIVK